MEAMRNLVLLLAAGLAMPFVEARVGPEKPSAVARKMQSYYGYGYGFYEGYESGEGCEEMYCYPSVYTEDGEIDWDQTYEAEASCASWEEGCPCNEEWEVQCESYGMKVCLPKTEGCLDPFAVECDEETEEVCKDEWSAYCWDKAWGNCPLFCGHDEIYCYSYSYDSTGEVNWTAPHTETCANMSTGCPCDDTWEVRCTDAWGYSWCNPKSFPCPITCSNTEQVCYMTEYKDDGEPDWSAPGNQTCVDMFSPCPCHPVHEELCNSTWGSYCQPTYNGQTCPISCKENEIYCYIVPYDDNGEIDWTATWEEACADESEGCPCNEKWEKSCGEGWCIPIDESCPIDCGEFATCWHESGNQSCATESGCSCEANEHSCLDGWGQYQCYPMTWYPDGCPLVCDYETHIYCHEVGFDENGFMTWEEFCHERSSADDWECPVKCKDSAQKCGTEDWNSYCVALTDSCPEVCTEDQQLCWVTDYDSTGAWLGGADKCAPANQECPCGQNSIKCSFEGYSYCESTYYGCPVTCQEGQKNCYIESYTPEGDYDWTVPANETCVAEKHSCPCGANAKACKWTDLFGVEEEYFQPEAWPCPISCGADQKKCYKTDYNASGYPQNYYEDCVAKDAKCTCGRHSQECHDPWWDEYYCMPTWDFWTNMKMSCPVYCKEDQDYCYIPSFDAKGDWVRTQEECVPRGQACDCKKGQNAFACTYTDPFWGSWTECLPTFGGYCPSSCPSDEVACEMVEDYLPNGTSLGLVQPPKKCAKDQSKCECGKEAKRCPSGVCMFQDEDCPVTCKGNEKKCYESTYNKNGEFVSDREVCVARNASCPCNGQGMRKCETLELCLLESEMELLCPCKEREEQCYVVNYDKYGKVSDFETQCVQKGSACKCGKNTESCPDPNDAKAKICVPRLGFKSCPKPCTSEEIRGGNVTCVQTNLDSSGNFKSETVTCIGANDTCPIGEGMKRCASGAMIAVNEKCRSLYSAATTGTRRLSSKALVRESVKVIITLGSSKTDAASHAETARVKLNSVLQLPNGMTSSIVIKTSRATRRVSERSLSTSSKGSLIYTVENQGTSTVPATQVGEELKKMVKSSSSMLTKALSLVGEVDSKAGVTIKATSTVLQSRATAAQEEKMKQAGITTRSTSKAPTTPRISTTVTDGNLSGQISSASDTFCSLAFVAALAVL